MAQLKDTVVAGDLSVTGTIYGDVPLNDLTNADDLKAIEALTGTSGILTKTAANTWSLSSGATPASHTHGKITNDGKIANADNVAIANGDRLIISDSSDSYILKNTSITFDGSTETKALTQKGTWATFNNYSHPTGAGNNHIPSGGSSGQFLGWDSAGTAKWVANPNTDTKVTQAAAITTAGDYPVLLGYSTATTAVTNTVNKTSTLVYNPNTKELTTNGTITLGNGTTAILNAKTPSRSSAFIVVGGSKKTAGTANGTVVRLGAGGLTLVGSGEYATNRYNVADLGDGDEQLYLGSDGSVYIETNAQTIANRKTFNFNTTGDLIVPTTTTATAKVRNIAYGTTSPSSGNNGDVYIQYASAGKPEIFPIGAIYMSVSAVNPSEFFAGTWTQVAQGRTIFGAGSCAGISYTSGTTVDAGLPNVSGNVVRAYSDYNKNNSAYSSFVSDPFYYNESETYGTSWEVASGSGDGIRNIYMDLGRANSIYGNSTTVQPNAFVCYIWQRTA